MSERLAGSTVSLRRAEHDDFDLVTRLFDQGRRFQRSLGFVQWLEGYPSAELFAADVDRRRGFVVVKSGVAVGYVVIDCGGDPEYDRLSHIWSLQGRYAVVHRLVLADSVRGTGLAKEVLAAAEHLAATHCVEVVRFDTGVRNTPMQRLLARAGYSCLGEHRFVWGPRLAYEKSLAVST